MNDAVNGAIVYQEQLALQNDQRLIEHVELWLERYTALVVQFMDKGFCLQAPGPCARGVDNHPGLFVVETVMRREHDGLAHGILAGPIEARNMTEILAVEAAEKIVNRFCTWYAANTVKS